MSEQSLIPSKPVAFLAEPIQIVKTKIGHFPRFEVADIGATTGAFAKNVSAFGWNVTAFETDPDNRIAFCERMKYATGWNLHSYKLDSKIQLDDFGRFDLIKVSVNGGTDWIDGAKENLLRKPFVLIEGDHREIFFDKLIGLFGYEPVAIAEHWGLYK